VKVVKRPDATKGEKSRDEELELAASGSLKDNGDSIG